METFHDKAEIHAQYNFNLLETFEKQENGNTCNYASLWNIQSAQ